jgi:hypothetical protein
METQKLPKIPKIFTCEFCNTKCSHKGDWNKHVLTAKHKLLSSGNEWKQVETTVSQKKEHTCTCGKVYSTKSGLWKHEKNCNNKSGTLDAEELFSDKKIIIELLKSNKELKELIVEQNKTMVEIANKMGTHTTNNNTNCNNTNNNHFNLQFFLNEQCKDALNIMDFINQLQLNTSDLDMLGRVGFTEGISKIFIRGLKELDIFKRPLHCSDLKREVVYVKHEDAWEKDSDEKKKMKNAIKFIAAKNFNQLSDWIDDNPEYNDYESKKHKEYHNIILKASGGATPEEDEKNYNKIIRNVAQEITIDKSGSGDN